MRRLSIIAAILCAGMVVGCSGGGSENGAEARTVTQTRMDDIDKIEGSISDEMIDTSDSSEEAPLATAETGAGAGAPETAPKKPAGADNQPRQQADAADEAP